MIQLFATELARDASYLQPSPDKLVDPDELRQACAAARRAGGPAIVMGASFAFVHILDGLGQERLALPEGSRVMHTGGFKGRSREVAPRELLSRMATIFAIPENAVVGEYGMTELSSQLYEGTSRTREGSRRRALLMACSSRRLGCGSWRSIPRPWRLLRTASSVFSVSRIWPMSKRARRADGGSGHVPRFHGRASRALCRVYLDHYVLLCPWQAQV